jgi:hypothetical protein
MPLPTVIITGLLLDPGEGHAPDLEVREGGRGEEHAHHVADVVGAQAVGAQDSGGDQAPARVAVEGQQVQAAGPDQQAHARVQDGGRDGAQHGRRHPGAGDLAEHRQVRDRVAEQVPAHDGADDGLGGGDREARLGHQVDGDGRAQRHREGARQRVDGAELAQPVGGAGAAHDGAEQDEDAGQQGGGAEADHPRGHGGAEDVRGVVGSEREAQEQAAREEDQDGEVHPDSPWW